MNRLIHNRVFIGILLMTLQLALLPSVGRCSSAQVLGDSCCCTASASVAAEGIHHSGESQPDCCSQRACFAKPAAPGNESDSDSDGRDKPPEDDSKETCSCPHGSDHWACVTEHFERDDSSKKHASASLSLDVRGIQSDRARSLRRRDNVALRVRTGPPLQLLYQVFLI